MSDHDWLKALYDAHYPMLYRLAARQLRMGLGSAEEAADVLQEVFLLAYEKNIRNHPNPAGWLVKTTDNLCKNFIRSQYRSDEKQRQFAQEKLNASAQRSLFFVHSAMDETALSDLVMTLEQSLPPEDWRLLRVYCLEQRPVEELAAAYDMTPNALRVRIFRVKKKVEEILQQAVIK